jgi:imidazolonepropionase-like amidohydrolase
LQVTGIKAGRLVDRETGVSKTDQILVENGKIKAIGDNIAIPAGAVR